MITVQLADLLWYIVAAVPAAVAYGFVIGWMAGTDRGEADEMERQAARDLAAITAVMDAEDQAPAVRVLSPWEPAAIAAAAATDPMPAAGPGVLPAAGAEQEIRALLAAAAAHPACQEARL